MSRLATPIPLKYIGCEMTPLQTCVLSFVTVEASFAPENCNRIFMALNVLSWQQYLMMGHEFQNVASPRSYVSAESISGGNTKDYGSN